MTDKVESASALAVATPKKAAAPKAKKPRVKASHPPTSEMVNAALKTLKERNGSSLQAIKKYITATYKIDAEKQASFIKKYLKSAVTSGTLIQTKGSGAAGSFKLAAPKKAAGEVKPKAPKAKVPKATKAKTAKPKAAAVKKSPKKPAAPKAKKPAKPKAAAKKPAISKKSAKTPTAKPKSPKAKKSPAKKAASKK